MSYPGAVGTVVASLSCDSAGFSKATVASEGMHHDADTFVFATTDPVSLVS